jgi:N-acetylglutamate synthase-like GNAT family acetyltransferase
MFDIMRNIKLKFRTAKINDKDKIFNILLNSFESYRGHYTEEGFKSTILSPEEIENRIKQNIFKVFVAVTLENEIVGTVSIIKQNDRYYIRSMAVEPKFQKKGIGSFILENICKIAGNDDIKKLSLESFEPLKKAIRFYKKHGFIESGITKDLHGNEIFEMIKILD